MRDNRVTIRVQTWVICTGFALLPITALAQPPTDPPVESEPVPPVSEGEPPEPVAEEPLEQQQAEPTPPEVLQSEVAQTAPPEQAVEDTDDPMREREVETVSFHPGEGLRIQSSDEEFRLQVRMRAQMMYRLAWADGEEAENEVTLRRARIQFSGHAFGENNRYRIELAIAPGDMGMRDNVGAVGATPDDTVAADRPRFTPLLDWYLEFTHLRDLSVRVGQYKIPFNRQRITSSGDLQMVDRSIVNSEFQLERDVGIMLFSKDFLGLELFRYALAVMIARGRDSVGFDDFGMLYLARIDFTPFGEFDDTSESDFERSDDPHLGVGVSAAFIDNARRNRGVLGNLPVDGGTTDTFHFVADAMFKIAGFSATTEFHVRLGDRNPGNALDEMGMPVPIEPPSEAWGLMLQAGYLLEPVPIEPVVHFSMIRRIGSDTESIAEDANALGLGVNWFIFEHPYKLQADFFRQWSDDFGTGENVFRLQLQGSI